VRESSEIIPQSPIKASNESKPAPDTRDARVLTFWRRVNRCHECPSIAPWRKFPLGRRGTTRFGLMILGEAPGRVSLENGRPFSNPRNLVIRNAFARAIAPRQIEPEQLFYFSDTVKCWPSSPTGANRSPSASENATCVERHLIPELNLARPRVIIAFGARAVAAVLGKPGKLAEIHGKPILNDAGIRVIPLMHPSTINIAGMRRVGIQSLDDYEIQLTALIRGEIVEALASFDHGLTLTTPQRFD
jgi:uracil-DNA glycosylase family 4